MSEERTDKVLAYRRDRSLYRSRPSGQMVRLHMPHPADGAVAACDSRVLLYDDDGTDVRTVRAGLCRKVGCQREVMRQSIALSTTRQPDGVSP